MKKYYLFASILILVLTVFTSVVYAVYVYRFESSSIGVETGTLNQELSINGQVMSDSKIVLKPLVFFDLLVDFKEDDAGVIFDDSVIVVDVVIKNITDTPFTFSLTSTTTDLVTYYYLDSTVTNYFETVNDTISASTTSLEVIEAINTENQTFITNLNSTVLHKDESYSFKILLFGYQPDATKVNEDFMNETYTYTLTSVALQYFEGELA